MSPDPYQAATAQEEANEAYSGSAGAGRILYRAMREDPTGGPMARTLGVRPGGHSTQSQTSLAEHRWNVGCSGSPRKLASAAPATRLWRVAPAGELGR